MNKYLIISIIILVSIISFLGYTNKKLSNQYAIAYENIKAYDESGINQVNHTTFSSDGVHILANGHEFISRYIASKINSL